MLRFISSFNKSSVIQIQKSSRYSVGSTSVSNKNSEPRWTSKVYMADQLAKMALTKGNIEMQVSISKAEVKTVTWEKINQKWQEIWDRERTGKQNIKFNGKVKETMNRREEIVISRLRMGHCLLNKTLKLIGKHNTGLCDGCHARKRSL